MQLSFGERKGNSYYHSLKLENIILKNGSKLLSVKRTKTKQNWSQINGGHETNETNEIQKPGS